MFGLEHLSATSLAEAVHEADLQTRIDRKYVVSADKVRQLVAANSHLKALEIDGSRSFRYRSVYFDTHDLASFRGAAHGRRRRFKVRIRTYVDTGTHTLEVKTRGLRGATVKDRLSTHAEDRLGRADLRFIEERIGSTSLELSLSSNYTRSTLIDPDVPYRVGIDREVTARDLRSGTSRSLGPWCVVETKSAGPPTDVDRWLWSRGERPVPFSKYCTSLAALNPHLPANKWHRSIGRYWSEPASMG